MRASPIVVFIALIVAGVVTVGASAAAYVGVRQLVIDSPVELPAPPQVGVVAATARPIFLSTETPGSIMVAATVTPTPPVAPSGATLDPNLTPTIPSWTRPTRFTVLLLGIDQRPQETGPFRTDTLIVLSMDPIRKTAAMLSIPRDVFVKIPGFAPPLSPNRINSANFIGDAQEYPGGGPALAKRTVESLLGIKIDRYVVVNFEAFKTVIDAIGPVNVCPTEHILDNDYPDTDTYGTIKVEFQPECQDLDSTRLLQYARVRHNAGDDFGRAKRQQEVIRGVKQKVLSLGGVSGLIGKAGPIWDALKNNVKTDLTFDEIIQLANMAQGIPEIKSGVLEIKTQAGGQLIPGKTADGQDVLSPVYEDVYQLVLQLFDSGQGAPYNAQASDEGATLYVANGAGIDGLAKETADMLLTKGFTITGVGNAEGLGLYGKSEIRVYSNKVKTARYLQQVLGLPDIQIVTATDGPPGVDIMLIVGKDLAGQ